MNYPIVRKLSWTAMTALAFLVAAYAAAALIAPSSRSEFVQNLFLSSSTAVSIHLIGGLLAIIAGAFQVNARLRARYLQAHRWLGRLYVVSVLAGGCAGLVLAAHATGGLVAQSGFGLMAVCWLGCTTAAYRCIRGGDIAGHRAWMLRSYALTLAAVTLRIYLPLSLMNGLPFEAAYQAISWLSWVPNILVVEWFVLTRRPVPPAD